MSNYIGFIHKDGKSDYGVSFSDFPGCVTAGKTLDEAQQMASEALEMHIEGMREDGEKIPVPSALDDVLKSPLAKGHKAVIAVSVMVARKKERVNVMLDEDLLRRIDAVSGNRSEFLGRAALHELANMRTSG